MDNKQTDGQTDELTNSHRQINWNNFIASLQMNRRRSKCKSLRKIDDLELQNLNIIGKTALECSLHNVTALQGKER